MKSPLLKSTRCWMLTQFLLLAAVWLLPICAKAQYPPATVAAKYKIINRRSGLALEIGGNAGSTIQAGQPANQWPYQYHGNQQWSIFGHGSGNDEFVNIESRNSTYALEPQNSSRSAYVVQRPCVNNLQQRWRITDVGGGYYSIVNLATGMALEIGGNYSQTLQAGQVASQWPYTGSDNQQWQLIQIASELESQYTHRITNRSSNTHLRPRLADVANGARLELSPYVIGCSTGAAYQEWYFRPTDNSYTYFAIINRNSGKAIEIGGSYAETLQAGQVANQWDYTGGDNQQWSEIRTSDGIAYINRRSGMALEIDGSATGALAVQRPYTGASNQLWGGGLGSTNFSPDNPTGQAEAMSKQGAFSEDETQPKQQAISTQGFVIYPNPATTTLILSLPTGDIINSVSITDMQGRKAGIDYDATGQLDISSLSAGLYIITVRGNQHEYRQKFNKQ